jgi:hypothetical protein
MTVYDAATQMDILNLAMAQIVTLAKTKAPSEPEDKVDPNGVVPPDVVRFLARLRLLEGVPFNYLVPDATMLPLESIRFFYVDRNWLDALVDGALSVGTVNSADREQLASLHAVVRAEVDTAERMVRMKDSDAPAVDANGRPIAVAGQMTGFLLRSKLVSGWPGMHVRAYTTDTRPDNKTIPDMDVSPDRVRLLRMERLAPAVLLVLFDGVPAVVHLEEPRSGIQFGVRMSFTDTSASAVLPLRDVAHPNDGFLQTPTAEDRTVPVPFRRGAPGVINIAELSTRLVSAAGTGLSGPIDSAQFAMELLRFPFRQVFGDTEVDTGYDDFVASLNTSVLATRFQLAVKALGGQP